MLYYFIIIIIIIIILFILYFVYPHTLNINQTSIEKFNFNLLYEKNPLILTNHIVNINSIIDIWFKYNFIYSTKFNNQSWINNKSKYLIIHNSSNSEKTEIHICNPYTNIDKNNNPCNNSKIISIELLHHQFMILPFNWYYFIDDSFINLYLIHDPITLLISSCSN